MHNVLIFEKDYDFRKKIKEVVELVNIDIYIYESCSIEEAINIMRKTFIDIFIVDISGFEGDCNSSSCIEKYLNPHNTIILTDKAFNDTEISSFINMEIFDIIFKPINLNIFKLKIHTLMRIVKRRKEFQADGEMLELELAKYIKIWETDIING